MNVGDKVVCVDDVPGKEIKMSLFPNWVKEGETYTVRAVEGSFGNGERVLLEELRNPSVFFPELGGKTEPGFAGKRFMPYEDFIMSEKAVEELTKEVELIN